MVSWCLLTAPQIRGIWQEPKGGGDGAGELQQWEECDSCG